ncbi:hypothetical protein SAMN06265378_10922 [Paracoccus sediminis]|uniref:MotA/TolQ/ExbB proton channel family protein n=2 Tax=Paracoccus sediminis TaxID=1214787 RepID=A0A238XAP0_9RHOB|nr:hypothetical protein SAMN06265378_10922 [Paracoccus sediminis]
MSEPTSQQPDPSALPRRPGMANRRITATRAAGPGPSSPRFSQPIRQIVMMVAVLALVMAGGWIAYGRILPIFRANMWLNGLILGVFALGVLACFWQVAQLIRSVSWIERFAKRRSNAVEKGIAAEGRDTGDHPPRLLAPLAALLGTRGPVGGVISTGAAASILDSVATRIDELRDITRYISNLLIFLGLLGTFYGLATTIPAVVQTIQNLAPQQGETGIQVFDKLMSGLEAQLGGMATAFSSSLLGLAGSLVVGLLELFATHGQNRFYRELEEWMSGFTRVSLAGSEGDGVDQAALAGFLEHMAGQMDRLQRIHAERDMQRDEAAAMADERVVVMAQAVEALVQRGDAERDASLERVQTLTQALSRLAEGQDRLIDLTRVQAERPAPPVPDLGGIEAALIRLSGDLTEGRDEMVAELRSDILVLTRAVRAARFNDPFRDDLLRDPLVSRDRG